MADITRRGVTLKEAWQEAIASAPINRVMLYTYELWHESMAEPIRFVNDNVTLFATLESDAPRDAGDEVEFLACPVDLQRPEESDTAESPTIELGRGDVGGILKAALDAARGSLEPWTIIERAYVSDNLTEPAVLPPQTFELSNVELAGAAARISAQYDDEIAYAVPRITFKREEYPGLKR